MTLYYTFPHFPMISSTGRLQSLIWDTTLISHCGEETSLNRTAGQRHSLRMRLDLLFTSVKQVGSCICLVPFTHPKHQHKHVITQRCHQEGKNWDLMPTCTAPRLCRSHQPKGKTEKRISVSNSHFCF